jgi:hypothetical protein
MVNDRLRDALMAASITPEDVASQLKVDPKTVERWITTGRSPYPRYRHKLAALLRKSEAYLWPDAMSNEQATRVSESEIVKAYAHRNVVPSELWDRLLEQCRQEIDILVYVGMFLTEKPNLLTTFRRKAESGVKIRMLFGDRGSPAVIQRSTDEGIGPNTISAKIDQALAYFRDLQNTSGVELRTHGTVLYNSIYRFDEEMVINPHVYGKMAPHAPALHLHRLSAGSIFDTYRESFDAVWFQASPYDAAGVSDAEARLLR